MNDTMNDTMTTPTTYVLDDVDEGPPPLARSLPCPLSQDELIALGDQIDSLIGEAEDLELQAKSSASDFRARLAHVAEQIARLSRQRKGRTIDREVEVEIVTDLSRCEEVVRRLDTGEIVTKRTMSRAEVAEARQTTIPAVINGMERQERTGADCIGAERGGKEGNGPERKGEESDPWANVPNELRTVLCLVDGEAEDLVCVETSTLRALSLYCKEKAIGASDERRHRIATELAKRKRVARKAQDEVGDGSGTGD